MNSVMGNHAPAACTRHESVVQLPPLTLSCEEGDVPDDAACYALWDKYAMLENIRAHSSAVADFATALARRAVELGYPVSVPTVRAGALLHDIAKTYTILHGGRPSQLGAGWAVGVNGNTALAQGILFHVYWPWEIMPDGIPALPFLILYADKRIQHERCVSLKQRYEDLLERYGKTAHSRAGIQLSYEQGMELEQALSVALQWDLHAYTLDCGRLVQRA